MDGQISFLEKFKKYSPKEEYRKILEKVSDYRIRTDKERKMIETFASFPEIVEKRILYDIESEICEAYQINSMRILPSYPPELFPSGIYHSLLPSFSVSERYQRAFLRVIPQSLTESESSLKSVFQTAESSFFIKPKRLSFFRV